MQFLIRGLPESVTTDYQRQELCVEVWDSEDFIFSIAEVQ